MEFDNEWLEAKAARLQLHHDWYKKRIAYFEGRIEELDFLLQKYLAISDVQERGVIMEQIAAVVAEMKQQGLLPKCKVQLFPYGIQSTIERELADRKELV